MAIVESISNGGGQRRVRISSPVTKKPIGEIKVANADEVRAAVARARGAQGAGGALSFDERAVFLRRAVKVLLRRQEEFMDVITRETGRSRVETIFMETFPACDSLSYYAKHAGRILGDK